MAYRGPYSVDRSRAPYHASQQHFDSFSARAARPSDSASRRGPHESSSYSSGRDLYGSTTPTAPRAHGYDPRNRYSRVDPPRAPRRDRELGKSRYPDQRRYEGDDPYHKPRPAPPPVSSTIRSRDEPSDDPRRKADAGQAHRRVDLKSVPIAKIPKASRRRAPSPALPSWDAKDPSIPLLFCCPSIGSDPILLHQIKASTLYPHLDLRFLPSFGDLSSDAHNESTAISGLSGIRRKCFVTPEGDKSVKAQARKRLRDEPLIWREAMTVSHLEECLEGENALVAAQLAKKLTPSSTKDPRHASADELARTNRLQVAVAPVAEKGEIQAIVRRETDAISPTVLVLEAAAADMEVEQGEVLDPSPNEPEGVRDEASASPTWSRKRHRLDSDESDESVEAHKLRKALEHACKLPPRQQPEVEQLSEREMQQVDQAAVLGERHQGLWSINKAELSDLAPQVQVLMARALHDTAQPEGSQLYVHAEATELLEKTVPWFVRLLKPIKSKMQATHTSAEPESTYVGPQITDSAPQASPSTTAATSTTSSSDPDRVGVNGQTAAQL